jgi:hypothetical protein
MGDIRHAYAMPFPAMGQGDSSGRRADARGCLQPAARQTARLRLVPAHSALYMAPNIFRSLPDLGCGAAAAFVPLALYLGGGLSASQTKGKARRQCDGSECCHEQRVHKLPCDTDLVDGHDDNRCVHILIQPPPFACSLHMPSERERWPQPASRFSTQREDGRAAQGVSTSAGFGLAPRLVFGRDSTVNVAYFQRNFARTCELSRWLRALIGRAISNCPWSSVRSSAGARRGN